MCGGYCAIGTFPAYSAMCIFQSNFAVSNIIMVKIVIIIFHLITFVLAGELIKTPKKNRYFITGRGCGVSTKIKYLNYFPEQLDNHECSFIDAKVVSNHPTIELKV